MRALLAPDIVRMWEAGRDQPPLERTLTLLSGGAAEMSRAELAALSIGRRDARLLELRRQVFGETLQAFAECPQCGSYLEMQFGAAEINQPNEDETPAILELASHGVTARFRSPTTADLAKAILVGDLGGAKEALLGQCLIEAREEGVEISAQQLPPEMVEEINRRMVAADPAAEVLLDLCCPVCAHSWEALFDIASFFWKEISANARRLLHEVDALARAYGWSEAEILGLSATRRQAYLELIGA
jgi:hypothetical protein